MMFNLRFVNVTKIVVNFLLLLCVIPTDMHACDLNHDWKTTKLVSFRDLSPSALKLMLERVLVDFPGRSMILDVKDLYQLKGQITEDGESHGVSKRSTSEVLELESKLIQSNFESSKIMYYSQGSYGYTSDQLYNPEVLENLASRAQVNYFVRVKLRQYSRLERDYKDNYPHNKHVFQKTIDHTADLTYAVISKKGRYVDFRDATESLSERIVFQNAPDKNRVLILEEGFSSDQSKWISKTNFLGLDTVNKLSQAVFQSMFIPNEFQK